MAAKTRKRYQKKNENLPRAVIDIKDGIAEPSVFIVMASECKVLKGALLD